MTELSMIIAICDDEDIMIKDLHKMLTAYGSSHGIQITIECFASGTELLNASGHFHIIFLDVMMEGTTGIQTAKLMRKRGYSGKIVFLTAFKDYVYEAFDVDASQYLLKPLKAETLYALLDRLKEQIEASAQSQNLFLLIKRGGGVQRILLETIHYFEVLDRKIYVHMDEAVYDFYENLGELEKRLPPNFFRCHRGYIVNLRFVWKFDHDSITLTNHEVILLSKRKAPLFAKTFLKYMCDEGGGNGMV